MKLDETGRNWPKLADTGRNSNSRIFASLRQFSAILSSFHQFSPVFTNFTSSDEFSAIFSTFHALLQIRICTCALEKKVVHEISKGKCIFKINIFFTDFRFQQLSAVFLSLHQFSLFASFPQFSPVLINSLQFFRHFMLSLNSEFAYARLKKGSPRDRQGEMHFSNQHTFQRFSLSAVFLSFPQFSPVFSSFRQFSSVFVSFFANFGEFRRVFASFGEFRRVFASFREFSRVFSNFGELWRVLVSFGEFW